MMSSAGSCTAWPRRQWV